MTKFKDSNAISRIILELAKANNWLSREDLKQKTKKEIQTIKNYLKNDISHLIDTHDFIENVNRNTGKGKTNIEKYKLKSGLDTLLTVFEYIRASPYHDDKKMQKELMQTDFFEHQIPEIKRKMFKDFNIITLRNSASFKEYEIKRVIDTAFMSPTAVHYLLKVDDERLKNARKELNRFYHHKSDNRINELIFVLLGLIFIDVIDKTIFPSKELILISHGYPFSQKENDKILPLSAFNS